MIVQQAQNAIVLEDMGVLESLRRGWNVFKSSVLSIVLMAVILAIIGGVVGLVVALPMMIVLIPAAIGVAATSGTAEMAIPLILGGCCFVILLPIILLVSGIIQTYTQTAWTLTYLRLTVPPAPPAPALDMAATL
jgi:membrane-anchored glycerophosphoryl diester phosphodiesterase (GDPDase)